MPRKISCEEHRRGRKKEKSKEEGERKRERTKKDKVEEVKNANKSFGNGCSSELAAKERRFVV